MSVNFNFKMLTVAREARGLTQLELVEKVPNLNQGNYSKMEKGLLTVPIDTQNNLARALGFPLTFFYKREPVHQPGNHYYRKRASMTRKSQSIMEGRMKCIMIWVDGILNDIEIPECKLPAIRVDDINTPSDIARKIRSLLKVEPGPIDNLVNLLERNGIILYFLKGVTEKFDGMTMYTNSLQPIIFINDSMPNDRKRFTIAHELGHLIMHLRFEFELLDIPEKEIEAEANEFASEFLIPFLDSRADLSNLRYRDLGTLKQYWKISKAALIYQAYKRKFIDANKYQNMLIELSKSGERKKESMDVELDEPIVLRKSADALISGLDYSMSDIQLILGITESDFNSELRQIRFNTRKLSIVV